MEAVNKAEQWLYDGILRGDYHQPVGKKSSAGRDGDTVKISRHGLPAMAKS